MPLSSSDWSWAKTTNIQFLWKCWLKPWRGRFVDVIHSLYYDVLWGYTRNYLVFSLVNSSAWSHSLLVLVGGQNRCCYWWFWSIWLGFTEAARSAGGKCLTFDEFAMRKLIGHNTVWEITMLMYIVSILHVIITLYRNEVLINILFKYFCLIQVLVAAA